MKEYEDLEREAKLQKEISEYEKILQETEEKIQYLKSNIKLYQDLDFKIFDVTKELENKNKWTYKFFNNSIRRKQEICNLEANLVFCQNQLEQLKPIDDAKQELEELKELEEYYNQLIGALKHNNPKSSSILEFIESCVLKLDESKLFDVKKESINSYSDDKYIMCHTTGFFPENKKILSGFDGKLINMYGTPSETVEKTYKGVTKSVDNYSSRRTLHFIMNSAVSSKHGFGNWDESPYVVLEPITTHKKQIRNTGSKLLNPGDTWTKESIELSDKAILLVHEKYYKKLTEEQKKQYKIIIFNGDREKSVNCVLNLLGYPVFNFDINTAAHRSSLDHSIESIWLNQNYYLSFINDYGNFSRDNFELSDDIIVKLYDIYINDKKTTTEELNKVYISMLYNEKAKKLCEKNNFSMDFLCFVLKSGLIKRNGKYVRMEYEDLYKFIESITPLEDEKIVQDFIDNNDWCNINDKIIEKTNKADEENININFEEIKNMPFEEINKFKNLKYAEYFQKILNEVIKQINNGEIYFTENGLKVYFRDIEKESLDCYTNDVFKFYKLNEEYKRLHFLIDCTGLTVEQVISTVNRYIKETNDKLTQQYSDTNSANIKI